MVNDIPPDVSASLYSFHPPPHTHTHTYTHTHTRTRTRAGITLALRELFYSVNEMKYVCAVLVR
jgi:hypothetical protein